jgi:hypothetical protein
MKVVRLSAIRNNACRHVKFVLSNSSNNDRIINNKGDKGISYSLTDGAITLCVPRGGTIRVPRHIHTFTFRRLDVWQTALSPQGLNMSIRYLFSTLPEQQVIMNRCCWHVHTFTYKRLCDMLIARWRRHTHTRHIFTHREHEIWLSPSAFTYEFPAPEIQKRKQNR